jgi:hypothetical protein
MVKFGQSTSSSFLLCIKYYYKLTNQNQSNWIRGYQVILPILCCINGALKTEKFLKEQSSFFFHYSGGWEFPKHGVSLR